MSREARSSSAGQNSKIEIYYYMKVTDNYRKHKSNNPVQKFLLGNFYGNLISIIRDLDDSGPNFAKATMGKQARMTTKRDSIALLQNDNKEDRNDEGENRNDEGGNDDSGQARMTGRILDAGCGEGFTLNKLFQNKIGSKLEGIDFSKDAISLGKKIHPHLSLRQGDIYKLPYKDNSFDLVLSTEVLEHLKEPEKALKEIIRVSKKYILLSVPNEPFFRLSNFLRGKNITRWGDDIDHINHWNPKSFQEFIKREKVKIIKIKKPFPWTMILVEKIVK